jgi:hypothetical protein
MTSMNSLRLSKYSVLLTKLIVAGVGWTTILSLYLQAGLPSTFLSLPCYACLCVFTDDDVCRVNVIDIGHTDGHLATFVIEVPRLNTENFTVDVHNDLLTISAESESAQPATSGGGNSVGAKRSFGKFTGTLHLPRGTNVSA